MPKPVIPTIAEVERIAALPDPVLRNLHITQCYHRLALVLAARLGSEANWCTFATWASKQAGQTIRKEDLPRTLAAFLGEEGQQAARQLAASLQRIGIRLKSEKLVDLMWRAADPEAAFTHSSDAVARGNLKVFAEIGREFARFYAACLADTRFTQEHLDLFLSGLRPGDPPDGQDYLRRAFRAYYQALFETQAKTRSELLLLANLQIGFHEQTRLQPEINEALTAPVITPSAFTHNLLKAYYPQSPWLVNTLRLVLRGAGRLIGFDAFVEQYLAAARRQVQSLVTHTMMCIELPPNTRLRLGEDLAAAFPPALRQIVNPDLAALLAQVDPTPDSTRESGADYWGDLPDRIHFIADMFRCNQTSPLLFDPPFTPEQTAALNEGRFPPGHL